MPAYLYCTEALNYKGLLINNTAVKINVILILRYIYINYLYP